MSVYGVYVNNWDQAGFLMPPLCPLDIYKDCSLVPHTVVTINSCIYLLEDAETIAAVVVVLRSLIS